jgi:hypothetical protein
MKHTLSVPRLRTTSVANPRHDARVHHVVSGGGLDDGPAGAGSAVLIIIPKIAEQMGAEGAAAVEAAAVPEEQTTDQAQQQLAFRPVSMPHRARQYAPPDPTGPSVCPTGCVRIQMWSGSLCGPVDSRC